MEHVTKTAFARAEKVCVNGPDKWAILDTVTEAAEVIGISHRTVSVLRALLTFLPTRTIPVGQRAIVFPSNATLCDRLHGMPESTLRRHLAHLVDAGLVSRHSSPNHKRYARRRAGVIALTFGLDLTPLAVRSAELANIARDECQRKETLRIERDSILVLRAQLQSCSGDHIALLHETHLVLRRKPNSDDYKRITSALESVLAAIIADPKSGEMSALTRENERHIDPETKPLIRRITKTHDMTLSDVLSLCTDIAIYFPQDITTWQSFITTSNNIAAMIGIKPNLLSRCKETLGPEQTAILMACLLQIASDIECPAAYLAHLLLDPYALNKAVLSILRSLQAKHRSIAS